ncbi:MAG: transcriptional antiterminator, Rof [Gammaproteobacteria bacterium]
MSPYHPIDCQIHSSLELHIMHGATLCIHWQDDDGETHIQQLEPVDIATEKAVGEFLLLDDSQGNRWKIRLDKIQSFKQL